VKDFRRTDGQVELVALGQGEQDVPAIARAAVECGARWLIVEQDDHPYGEPMENMRISCRCLKEIQL
jgi:sugar phosphate isomerase/epimerase